VNGNYSIEDHNHRFAAWGAARAASTSPLCRFKVSDGVKALEAAGFTQTFGVDELPIPAQFNKLHKKWRNDIINLFPEKNKKLTHGVAAKLINVYLKARFICGGYYDNSKVMALHPPIDSVLLKSLKDYNVGGFGQSWKKFANLKWSKFDSDQYEEVIQLIRTSLDGEPLWMIEKYWQGFR